MREILFRGKRKSDGKWIESSSTLKSGEEIYFANINTQILCYGNSNVINSMEGTSTKPIFYRIRNKTVGQYTGLNDKNGNKIFEGDIVKHDNKIYVIKYLEKYARFAPTNSHSVFMVCAFEQLEIIGNIHDNPELLKGE